jgi:hypothetical protein
MMRLPFFTSALLLGVALGALGADDKPGVHDAAWIDRLVKENEPKADEKRFDEIGWAKDIREAERLAKEHQRPVMLFTHDGRMNIGRC